MSFRKLPPLNELAAFEAIARHRSFTLRPPRRPRLSHPLGQRRLAGPRAGQALPRRARTRLQQGLPGRGRSAEVARGPARRRSAAQRDPAVAPVVRARGPRLARAGQRPFVQRQHARAAGRAGRSRRRARPAAARSAIARLRRAGAALRPLGDDRRSVLRRLPQGLAAKTRSRGFRRLDQVGRRGRAARCRIVFSVAALTTVVRKHRQQALDPQASSRA